MHVADGHIQRVILIVSCCNRDRGLVTAQNDRYKCGSMHLWILRDQLLPVVVQISKVIAMQRKKLTAWFHAQSPDMKSLY